MISIDRLDIDQTRLRIEWSDSRTSDHPWIWVRDHSHDPATIHPATHQRQLYTADIDPAIVGASADVTGEVVTIAWEDASQPDSVLPIAFLLAHRDGTGADDPTTERVLWDGASIVEEWPTAPYDAVIGDDPALGDAHDGFNKDCFKSSPTPP